MLGRFIALCGARPERREAAARIARIDGMRPVLDAERLALFADAVLPHCAVGDGALLGRLFLRGQTKPVQDLEVSKQAASIASRGEFLVETCWGSYVAILPDPDGVAWHILRAPLGLLPCLSAQHHGLTWIASDVRLLEQAGLDRRSVDWDAVALHLVQPELRHSRTCLTGIRDLLGGFRLTVNGRHTTTDGLWSPWPFARQSIAPDDAVRRLRGAVDLTVSGMTEGSPSQGALPLSCSQSGEAAAPMTAAWPRQKVMPISTRLRRTMGLTLQ